MVAAFNIFLAQNFLLCAQIVSARELNAALAFNFFVFLSIFWFGLTGGDVAVRRFFISLSRRFHAGGNLSLIFLRVQKQL